MFWLVFGAVWLLLFLMNVTFWVWEGSIDGSPDFAVLFAQLLLCPLFTLLALSAAALRLGQKLRQNHPF